MAFEKKYSVWAEKHQRREWASSEWGTALKSRDMLGQRVGILGYGSVGRQVGRVAKAFGMEVFAFTSKPRDTPESRKAQEYYLDGTGDPDGTIPLQWFSGTDKQSLHHFLSQRLDLLVLTLPSTPQSRHLLGREEFTILAKHSLTGGAFLSNIARADIVKQDGLVEALSTPGSGIIGAALDTTDPEPLPKESPLWDAPNCFITPHMSSLHNRFVDRVFEIMASNIERGFDKTFVNEIHRS